VVAVVPGEAVVVVDPASDVAVAPLVVVTPRGEVGLVVLVVVPLVVLVLVLVLVLVVPLGAAVVVVPGVELGATEVGVVAAGAVVGVETCGDRVTTPRPNTANR